MKVLILCTAVLVLSACSHDGTRTGNTSPLKAPISGSTAPTLYLIGPNPPVDEMDKVEAIVYRKYKVNIAWVDNIPFTDSLILLGREHNQMVYSWLKENYGPNIISEIYAEVLEEYARRSYGITDATRIHWNMGMIPPISFEEAEKKVYNKYGVQVIQLGCMVTDPVYTAATHQNEMVKRELMDHYGSDVMQKISKEVAAEVNRLLKIKNHQEEPQ